AELEDEPGVLGRPPSPVDDVQDARPEAPQVPLRRDTVVDLAIVGIEVDAEVDVVHVVKRRRCHSDLWDGQATAQGRKRNPVVVVDGDGHDRPPAVCSLKFGVSIASARTLSTTRLAPRSDSRTSTDPSPPK